jgi:hypothetical protein
VLQVRTIFQQYVKVFASKYIRKAVIVDSHYHLTNLIKKARTLVINCCRWNVKMSIAINKYISSSCTVKYKKIWSIVLSNCGCVNFWCLIPTRMHMEFVIYLKDRALHISKKSRRALSATIRGSWNKQEHHMGFNAGLLKKGHNSKNTAFRMMRLVNLLCVFMIGKIPSFILIPIKLFK